MSPIKTILHPTDFSESSRHAGDFALGLAKDYGGRMILLHVLEPPIHSPELAAIALADESVIRTSAEQELLALKRAYGDVRCDHVLAEGFAAAEIVRVAGDLKPDLIVLGTHGRRGLGRLVMGSVAEEVIRRAPCPVLTAKPTDVQPAADYEDWIAEKMAAPEGGEPRYGREAGPETLSRVANPSYAATVEQTVRTTNRWLRDVRLYLPEQRAPQTFRLVRAVLHALRDHLPVDAVASLSAQLPLLLRGILYEGWDPSRKPARQRHAADLIEQVKAQVAPEPLDHPEQAIHAVLAGLAAHLTAGEVNKIKRALPHEIRELWESGLARSFAAN